MKESEPRLPLATVMTAGAPLLLLVVYVMIQLFSPQYTNVPSRNCPR
jgi:hypothetical protein